MMILTYLLLKVAFKNRSDNNPNLKYFTASDFDDVLDKPIAFKTNNGLTLRGFVYQSKAKNIKTRNQLIIFNHGIGAGHHAYMHFIVALIKEGFTVLAYDNTGCRLSEGQNIIGLTQAIIDLKNALDYIESSDVLNKLPISVIGHSWGGFTASQAIRLSKKVKAIVSIAGFNDVPYILGYANKFFKFLKPFIVIANCIKFGKYGSFTVTKAIKKSDKPMLLIAGKNDSVIDYKKNYSKYLKAAKNKANISFYLDEDKYHNPYLSLKGEQYFNEIFTKLRKFKKAPPSEEKTAFFNQIDYNLITENDPLIIKEIVTFLTK